MIIIWWYPIFCFLLFLACLIACLLCLNICSIDFDGENQTNKTFIWLVVLDSKTKTKQRTKPETLINNHIFGYIFGCEKVSKNFLTSTKHKLSICNIDKYRLTKLNTYILQTYKKKNIRFFGLLMKINKKKIKLK